MCRCCHVCALASVEWAGYPTESYSVVL